MEDETLYKLATINDSNKEIQDVLEYIADTLIRIENKFDELTGKRQSSSVKRSNAKVSESANPARQAYLKKWREEHPEAISRYNRQYWERRLKREQEIQKG